MAFFALILHLTGALPLLLATGANRSTTLFHALTWACCAWLGWLAVILQTLLWGTPGNVTVYLALSLTGCAGVGVLGARRPGVGAWNFVLVGLLAVLLLPVAQGLGELRLVPAQVGFLALLLVVVVLNHLPTRFGVSALLLGAGSAVQLCHLAGYSWARGQIGISLVVIAAVPVAAWAGLLMHRDEIEPLRKEWLRFRDRFGCLWAVRIREQFHRAAANAGKEVRLNWGGHILPPSAGQADDSALLNLLRATMKRFGVEGL